jgi:hypothetical protein
MFGMEIILVYGLSIAYFSLLGVSPLWLRISGAYVVACMLKIYLLGVYAAMYVWFRRRLQCDTSVAKMLLDKTIADGDTFWTLNASQHPFKTHLNKNYLFWKRIGEVNAVSCITIGTLSYLGSRRPCHTFMILCAISLPFILFDQLLLLVRTDYTSYTHRSMLLPMADTANPARQLLHVRLHGAGKLQVWPQGSNVGCDRWSYQTFQGAAYSTMRWKSKTMCVVKQSMPTQLEAQYCHMSACRWILRISQTHMNDDRQAGGMFQQPRRT